MGAKINMEDRGVTKELLEIMYVEEYKTLGEIRATFNITEGALNRWLKESGIARRGKAKYEFNTAVFDTIDNEEKAYWMGFLWSDGYVAYRENKNEYSIKLELAIQDVDHLEKFKTFLGSKHPINTYEKKSFDGKSEGTHQTCRLMMGNEYFGRLLQEEYGLVPHRGEEEANKLLSKIPKELLASFYRGVFDADGSFVVYYDREYIKYNFNLCTNERIVDSFQDFLVETGVKENKIQTSKRHEGRDGEAVNLGLQGRQQNKKLFELIYLNSEEKTRMERKYKKFKKVEEDK